MWVVERCTGTAAHELLHTNLNRVHALVVLEMRYSVAGHILVLSHIVIVPVLKETTVPAKAFC